MCDMLMSAGAAREGAGMSGDMSIWGVSLASRGSGTPSRELERVVARPELRILRLQLREAPLELRDAGAE